MIDRAYLDSLVELLGKDTINEIRLIYLQESAQKLDDLAAAWKNQNYTDLQEISHSLKSSSLSMAMTDLAEQCREIEEFSKLPDKPNIDRLMKTLSKTHQKSLVELADYFSGF